MYNATQNRFVWEVVSSRLAAYFNVIVPKTLFILSQFTRVLISSTCWQFCIVTEEQIAYRSLSFKVSCSGEGGSLGGGSMGGGSVGGGSMGGGSVGVG